ncbi:decaprenyl-phosphate phosphoribosyltransferase [Paenibacillus sambharensis]|uniref:decaprenyl-phosphate phosphoribosyltransferase n=1 Tax=Paenibacillus sambharensis TaxID=1803190 RepID=UPI001FECB6FD|nr:decaprenyl-phosphate phosphoribosyltransferase [Paenibacillus sambharensis]
MQSAKTGIDSELQLQGNLAGLLWRQLRPKQWTKNLLVFAAPLFSFEVLNTPLIVLSVAGYILLCLVSSCVYILNDFVDREADKLHPQKKNRPMASGLLNPYLALALGGVLLVSSLAASILINPLFTLLLAVYFTVNVMYSFHLKHVVLVDIMVIASGFVLRAIAGGLIIDVPFTPWFLLCTLLLSLFLAIGKRRNELMLNEQDKTAHRRVLEQYSFPLLDQLSSIVTTATIVSYSLFTFTSGRTVHLMWTIPLVIYGVFRYLYLIHVKMKGGAPDRELFEDKPILVTVCLYVLMVIVILAYFE